MSDATLDNVPSATAVVLTQSERRHDRALRAKFGITEAQYAALLDEQGGVCGICGTPPIDKRLAVDHDHRNGPIRGLLCEACNYRLGMIHDDAKWVCAVCEYLRGKFSAAVARICGADHRVTNRPRRHQPGRYQS